MKWWVLLLVVLLTPALAHAEFEFSVTPQSIVVGEEVLIYAKSTHENIQYMEVYKEGEGEPLFHKSCSNTFCSSMIIQESKTLDEPGDYTFILRAIVAGSTITADTTATVHVEGIVKPLFDRLDAPSSADTTTPVEVTTTFRSGSYDLEHIVVDFGDGIYQETISCENMRDECTGTVSHTYEENKTYTITATASDVEGNTQTQTRDITIVVGDSDGDGITDDLDQCPNTPLGATVATQGEFIGCSCEQLRHPNQNPEDTNLLDDGNQCTEGVCEIDSDGYAVITQTPRDTPRLEVLPWI